MALHINNSVVENQVRNLASLTGESITDAIGAAVEERLRRVGPTGRGRPDPCVAEILDLVASFRLDPVNEELTDDEILGYGPNGYSE